MLWAGEGEWKEWVREAGLLRKGQRQGVFFLIHMQHTQVTDDVAWPANSAPGGAGPVTGTCHFFNL